MRLLSSTNAVILLAVVSVIACLVYLVMTVTDLGSFQMSMHGWIALSIGTVLSILVGGGLAAVLIISRRNGYDDAAHNAVIVTEEDK